MEQNLFLYQDETYFIYGQSIIKIDDNENTDMNLWYYIYQENDARYSTLVFILTNPHSGHIYVGTCCTKNAFL